MEKSIGARGALRRVALMVVAAAAIATSSACGMMEQGPTAATSGKGDDHASPPIRLLTFNTALARVFPHLEARADEIGSRLAGIDADVVCLQEVWDEGLADRLAARLGGQYRHIWRSTVIGTPKKTSQRCDWWRFGKMASCKLLRCSGMSSFDCVGAGGPCHEAYEPLSDGCKRCVAANPSGIAAAQCVSGVSEPNAYYAEGRDGLLLLSKLPVEGDAVVTTVPSEVIQRRAISATLRAEDGQRLLVHCTHTAADLSIVPHPDGPDGWRRDNISIIEQLVDGSEVAGGEAWSASDRCRVLMGDLNTGPRADGLAGELVDNYARLVTPRPAGLGFVQRWTSPRCTACDQQGAASGNDNVIARGEAPKARRALGANVIDHILFWSNPSGDSCPSQPGRYAFERVLDEPMTIDGSAVHLSDHFGVLVTIQPDEGQPDERWPDDGQQSPIWI